MKTQGKIEPMTPMKEKKFTPQVGLELGTFKFKEQNTTTEPRRLIT